MYVNEGRHSKRYNHHHKKRSYHRKASFPERAWIQFLALRIIHENPLHGYKLIEKLENLGYIVSGRFETGSIYIILRRMEKKGFLKSEKIQTPSERTRRVYSITDKGLEQLKKGLESVIERKRIYDELSDYYNLNFTTNESVHT
jgi:DNA-binding PadR family transcriptional regulator